MEEVNLASSLLDRILLALIQENVDIQKVRSRMVVILDDYEITPKETALTVYSAGKNELFVKRFAVAKAVAGRTERTVKQYQSEVTRFLNKIGKDADTVTSSDVQAYIARMITSGRSKSYCDTVRRYLNSFYGYLYREELIRTNPMAKVDGIKFHREKEPAFSDMELELMRAACRNTMERAVIEMLLSTGCRAAELVSIRRCDINPDGIVIRGKGEKYRTVWVNARASVAIAAYLRERQDNNPYLFPAGIFGGNASRQPRKNRGDWFKNPALVSLDKPYGHESVNSLCKRVAKRAGVDGAHAHRFRRTCATQALRHGMPIEKVSMMLGHEQISTTQIYLDIQQDELAAAHKKYVI